MFIYLSKILFHLLYSWLNLWGRISHLELSQFWQLRYDN